MRFDSMMERIGVFVCECGQNIKDALSVDEVVAHAERLGGVAVARATELCCSDDGCAQIEREVRDRGLTRVVVAACSPREHEHTFRKACARAGLNAYSLQMANIREQCAWVIKEPARATALARALVSAAVARVVHHEELTEREVDSLPDALVIGAGVAGISAALTLAQRGRKVHVVEKLPAVGGRVVRYGELAPALECAPCILQPLIDQLLQSERIALATHSEVASVIGDVGNYTVEVRRRARYIDPNACVGCGACVEVCPVRVAGEPPSTEPRAAAYVPWKGALPNVPLIDPATCLRFKGEECTLCKDACAFDAVRYEDQDRLEALRVGAVVVATGASTFDPRALPQYRYGELPEVYTSVELELMLSKNGCTQGKVVRRDGAPPKRVAILHCVGSLTPKANDYCSNVCCGHAVKMAHLLRAQLPEASIVELHGELCIGDKGGQALLRKVQREDRVEMIRLEAPDALTVEPRGDEMAVVSPELAGRELAPFDMVVLAVGMTGGADARALAEALDIGVDRHGFFQEAHHKLDPTGTTATGVMVAGCAQWPKGVDGSVAQAQAAAGKVLSKLVVGERLTVSPEVAEVMTSACAGCKMCIGLCPYRAISLEPATARARINDTLCKGCGVCAASCPSQAIALHHSTEAQLLAEMKALLREP